MQLKQQIIQMILNQFKSMGASEDHIKKEREKLNSDEKYYRECVKVYIN